MVIMKTNQTPHIYEMGMSKELKSKSLFSTNGLNHFENTIHKTFEPPCEKHGSF